MAYRVCMDCDKMIAPEGDRWHEVSHREDGTELFIGCEGYHHTVSEGRIQG